jgi:hypothetical protein
MLMPSALIRHTVQPFTESDDIRCCDNTFCPPDDGHVDAVCSHPAYCTAVYRE